MAVVAVQASRPNTVRLTVSGSPAAGTVGTPTAPLLVVRLVCRVDAHDLDAEIVQCAQDAPELHLVGDLAGEHRLRAVELDGHRLERAHERRSDLAPDHDPIKGGRPAAAGGEALRHAAPQCPCPPPGSHPLAGWFTRVNLARGRC